ncbi:MAG: hypothetical protein V4719_04920 [Planctomycetota bacterium]
MPPQVQVGRHTEYSDQDVGIIGLKETANDCGPAHHDLHQMPQAQWSVEPEDLSLEWAFRILLRSIRPPSGIVARDQGGTIIEEIGQRQLKTEHAHVHVGRAIGLNLPRSAVFRIDTIVCMMVIGVSMQMGVRVRVAMGMRMAVIMMVGMRMRSVPIIVSMPNCRTDKQTRGQRGQQQHNANGTSNWRSRKHVFKVYPSLPRLPMPRGGGVTSITAAA